MELYRYLIDDLVIEFSRGLSEKDFIYKDEWFSSNRLGKRQVLNKEKTRELTASIHKLWEKKVEIPRIKHGKKQTLDTLISEEAYLLAKFLRNERKEWNPRIVAFTLF